MSIDLTVDFEGAGPAGTNLSAANTGFAAVTLVGGGTAVSSATAHEGSLSGKLDSGSGQNSILRDDFTARSTNADRWYGRITGAPAAVFPLQQALSTSTVRGRLRLTTGRLLSIQNGSTTVATMTTVVPIDEWFRVEWKIDNAASTQWARLFIGANVDGTTPDEEISGTFNTGTINRVQVGILADPTAAMTLFVDHYVNDTVDWVGPGVVNATVTPSTVTAVAAVPSATASAGQTVTAATVAATTTVPAAAVATGSTVTAATVAAVATVPDAAVSVGGSVDITPATVTALAAIPAADVSTGSTVAPATVAALAAAGSVTVATGATVTPASVAASAAIPAAAVSTGANLSATVVQASAAVPSALSSAGSTVAPATVSAVAAVPSSTTSAGASFSADTVAAVASVNAATVVVTARPSPRRDGARPGVRPRDSVRGTPGNRRRRR